jgi:hypothetical protein
MSVEDGPITREEIVPRIQAKYQSIEGHPA